MSDRLHIELLGAAPELATLRILDHTIHATLDLLDAVYADVEPAPQDVEDLVAALHDAQARAGEHARVLCRDMTRTDTQDYAEDDIF